MYNKYKKYKQKYRILKKLIGGSYDECINYTEKIIDNNMNCDNECLNNMKLKCGINYDDYNSEIVDNIFYIIDKNTKCIRLNKKCDSKYYNNVYDGSIIKLDMEKFGVNDDIFCVETYNNCCNCISISLYSFNLNDIVKYISSIKRTIKNVKIGLPEWIVRVYFDISVYISIKDEHNIKIKEYLDESMKFILSADNVEVYVYTCKAINNNILRIQRYMSLCDKSTNIVVIREADGFVTLQDCYNIKYFSSKSPLLLYQIPILKYSSYNFDNKNNIVYSSYNPWYSVYKTSIESTYFNKKWNIYDILAGTIAFKIKLNQSSFFSVVGDLISKLNNFMRECSYVVQYITNDIFNKVTTNIIIIEKMINSFKTVEKINENKEIYKKLIYRKDIYGFLLRFSYKTNIDMNICEKVYNEHIKQICTEYIMNELNFYDYNDELSIIPKNIEKNNDFNFEKFKESDDDLQKCIHKYVESTILNHVSKYDSPIKKKNSLSELFKSLIMGFDELLLMDIFKDFISYDKNDFIQKISLIEDHKNINLNDSVNEITNQLVIKQKIDKLSDITMSFTSNSLWPIEKIIKCLLYDVSFYQKNRDFDEQFYNIDCGNVDDVHLSLANFVNIPYITKGYNTGDGYSEDQLWIEHIIDSIYDPKLTF